MKIPVCVLTIVILHVFIVHGKKRIELIKKWGFGDNISPISDSISQKQTEKNIVITSSGRGNNTTTTGHNTNDDENQQQSGRQVEIDVDDEDLFSKTFVELYEIGVEAYLENNWRDCIVFLEAALHEYHIYRQTIINCRMECWFESQRTTPLMANVNVDNLQFYDNIVQRTLCLGKCHNRYLHKQYLPPFYLHKIYRERFQSMLPYEYLQLCYYKVRIFVLTDTDIDRENDLNLIELRDGSKL